MTRHYNRFEFKTFFLECKHAMKNIKTYLKKKGIC